MCGIAGIVTLKGGSPSAETLTEMIGVVNHRGPDERGVHIAGPVGLAHARLSIIDLAHGQQPMCNQDQSLWVTFNGEIFNHIELREDLKRRGHHFATRSDTEVILHMYEEYGEACVHHFNGQWAIAVWEAKRRRLFLSRDRIGIRPLFYANLDEQFVFASEMKSILAHPSMPRRPDPLALNQLFTFWTTLPPRTVFEQVMELPPGHNLTLDQNGTRIGNYWQLEYPDEFPQRDEEAVTKELLELLIDATRLRLRSDVPVGAYLSGGLDSSVIVALIDNFTDTQLETFSLTFADPEFDESRFQRDVTERLRTDHHQVHCTGEEIGRVFPQVIWHTEKPVLRTAPAPMYLLSRLVHEHHYKVVLTGEGADEMLGGYDIFKEAKIRRFWARQPHSSMRPLLLKRLYPYMPQLQSQSTDYLKAFFHINEQHLASPFFSHLPRWELTAKLRSFFSQDVREACRSHDPYVDLLATLPEAFSRWHPFCQAQYLESTGLLPGYILSSQGDRMAMAHSVEGRFPFLDHRVMEFAARLPPNLKMNVLCEKYLLKQATRELVPQSVTNRPKQPYRAPDTRSFLCGTGQRRLRENVRLALGRKQLIADGLFNPTAVEHLVKKCESGRAIGVKDNMALVGVVSTQLLMDQFVSNFRRQVANGNH